MGRYKVLDEDLSQTGVLSKVYMPSDAQFGKQLIGTGILIDAPLLLVIKCLFVSGVLSCSFKYCPPHTLYERLQ